MSNVVVVNLFKRPFHARLCLEALARAQRWSATVESKGWADVIAVCLACNASEHPYVIAEAEGVIERNPDVPFEFWRATPDIPSNPHAMSKWMLDRAFAAGADMALYVEDDAVMAPDAFLMCEWVKWYAGNGTLSPPALSASEGTERVIGCCLYHETIPAQYKAEGRPEGPDARLLHLSNGLNTCGGTAFLREPYLHYLQRNWNCKTLEPRGFDYSAHYLMYVNNLFMVWPDLSRSHNTGYELGSISQPAWARYFGRSIWAHTKDAARDWREFIMDGAMPQRVRELWMAAELQKDGLL
jgi:hypothetical protein